MHFGIDLVLNKVHPACKDTKAPLSQCDAKCFQPNAKEFDFSFFHLNYHYLY